MSRTFSSISIRLKVVLAFALVLLCTIGLGVFALQRLDGVNNVAASIRSNSLPATRVLGNLAYQTTRLRQLEASGGPALPIGTRGTLEAEHIAMKLPFMVRAADGQSLHLAFELDATQAVRFKQILGRIGSRIAA